MSRAWMRGEPTQGDSVLAGLVALGAAALTAGATYYVTRLLLARSALELRPDAPTGREETRAPGTDRALPR
jgi:hypothetical protein